jgi:hypothetical protein
LTSSPSDPRWCRPTKCIDQGRGGSSGLNNQ